MNIWFHGLALAVASATIIAWVLRDRPLWPAATLACFIAVYTRAIHHVGEHAYMFHDGLFYWSATESVLETGELQASLSLAEWYPGAQHLLDWPLMNVLAASIIEIIGITPQTGLYYISSLFAVPLLLVAWAAYRTVAGDRFGLLAAYATAMLDTTIYYQLQHHQQGFAILFVIAIIWLLLRHAEFETGRSITMVGLIGVGVLLSHRFTGVLTIIFLASVVGLAAVWRTIRELSPYHSQTELRVGRLFLSVVWVGVVGVSAHLLLSPGFVTGTIVTVMTALLEGASVSPSPPGSGGDASKVLDRVAPLLKVLVGGLALPTILSALAGRESPKVEWLAIATAVAGLLTLPILVVAIAATPRLVMVGYLPLMGLAFVTLSRLYTREWGGGWLHSNSDVPISSLAIGGVVLLVVLMGATAGSIPSLIDHDADLKSDGYEDVTPIGDEAPEAGAHINQYGADGAAFAVTFRTRMIPLYYGKYQDVEYVNEVDTGSGQHVIGVYDTARDPGPPRDTGSYPIYDNGRITLVIQDENSEDA